ncbi:MAG: hypothetical protein JWP28_2383 [Phenylobacterium sp.]|uniref:hypothetical protein n=1 Tax=Phenylobacterium sp. TaxID=1871053 RepID=UPI0026283C34|nr:hypothetical protein [Phenylobacterium sp.]MDB5498352.1 hypothetical protein [Phenylobacterium sp.]
MPMYIFYPCLEDGTATSFEAFELKGDEAAFAQGELVLGGHASATHVMAWRDGQALPPIRRAFRRATDDLGAPSPED